MEAFETIRPGRYRHFKGNEYRVLYTIPPGTARRWSPWWCIRPSTGSGASGSGPRPCGTRRYSGTAGPLPGLPISGREKPEAAAAGEQQKHLLSQVLLLFLRKGNTRMVDGSIPSDGKERETHPRHLGPALPLALLYQRITSKVLREYK